MLFGLRLRRATKRLIEPTATLGVHFNLLRPSAKDQFVVSVLHYLQAASPGEAVDAAIGESENIIDLRSQDTFLV